MGGSLPEGLTQLVLTYDFNRLGREFYRAQESDTDDRIDAHAVALEVRHHLGQGWAIDARVPTGAVAFDPDGGATRRASGLGDVELGGRYEFGALWGIGGYKPSLTLRLGLGLPTGEANLAGSASDDAPPSVLAIGTGAFSIGGQFTYTQFLARWIALTVPVATRVPISRNEQGNLIGAQLSAGAGAMFVTSRRTQVSIGTAYLLSDQADNDQNGPLTNSGGRWLLAHANGSAQLNDATSVWMGFRLPLHTYVNGTQLSQSFAINAGMALSFGMPEEEEHDHSGGHDHGGHAEHGGHGDAHGHGGHGGPHGHGGHPGKKEARGSQGSHGERGGHDGHGHGGGDAPAPTPPDPPMPEGSSSTTDSAATTPRPDAKANTKAHRADVSDAAVGGKSFALAQALSAGKLTVIDFWATWCKPCATLDHDLRRLAGKHPGLSVRRVEITEADCPAAQEHLDGSPVLPAVWIHGPDGKRLEDLRGASPREIVSAVEKYLHAGAPH